MWNLFGSFTEPFSYLQLTAVNDNPISIGSIFAPVGKKLCIGSKNDWHLLEWLWR